jgi:tetratricopeptide (TPR) repeat protein
LDTAIKLWKKEPRAGAAPLLAEGVLLDCLGRLQGVTTRLVSTEVPLPPPFTAVAERRPSRAARAFDAALKIDPHLIEARMRAARIRAPSDSDAVLELERVTEDQTGSPFPYLAAISRAEVALAQKDSPAAIRWYQRALELNPRSSAATIALSVLTPGAPLVFDTLDTTDLYYTYPCRVLTSEVDAALAERVRTVVLK